MLSHTFDAPAGFEAMSKLDQALHRLQDLRGAAQKFGFGDLFKELVDPWIDQEARCGRAGQPSDTKFEAPSAVTGTQQAFEASSAVEARCGRAGQPSDTTLDEMTSTLQRALQPG